MMNETVNFDTLQYARDLREEGFTKQQAEGLARVQAKYIGSNLATKQDITNIYHEIKDIRREIKDTRHEIRDIHAILDKMDQRIDKMDQRIDKMDQRIDKMDQRIDKMDERIDNTFKWVIGAIFASMSVTVGMVGLMLYFFR